MDDFQALTNYIRRLEDQTKSLSQRISHLESQENAGNAVSGGGIGGGIGNLVVSVASQKTSGAYVGALLVQLGVGDLPGNSSVQFYGENVGVNVYETNFNLTGGVIGSAPYIYLNGPATVASGIGLGVTMAMLGPGRFSVSHGIYVNTEASAAGIFDDHHGLTIADFFNPGGATMTKFAGIVVPDLTAASASNLVLGAAGAPTGTFSIYNVSTRDNFFGGSLQLGDYSSGRPAKLYSSVTHTTTGATISYGYWANVTATPASNSAAFFRGIAAFMNADANVNYTGNTIAISGASFYNGSGTFSNIRAGQFDTTLSGSGTATLAVGAGVSITNSSNGTITDARALTANIINSGTGTITAGYGLRIVDWTNSGGGTFTGAAGIAMADMAVGTNRTNVLLGTTTIPSGVWNIYSPSTLQSRFDGVIGIGANPTSAITIGAMSNLGYLTMTEITAPGAAAVDGARVFVRDNGAGKTQLCVVFNTGAIQVMATQP